VGSEGFATGVTAGNAEPIVVNMLDDDVEPAATLTPDGKALMLDRNELASLRSSDISPILTSTPSDHSAIHELRDPCD
jgi:hypothetical protein